MIAQATLAALLDRATTETIGLFVETNNVNALTQQITNQFPGCRETLGIMICKPALPNTIFIMKRSVELSF
jgi:hypothetical protein